MFCLQLGSPSAQVDDVQTGAASGRSARVKGSGRLLQEPLESRPVRLPAGLLGLKARDGYCQNKGNVDRCGFFWFSLR